MRAWPPCALLKSARVTIVGVSAAAVVGLLGSCGSSGARRHALEEETRLVAAEVEGLDCLSKLAKRDPRRDAEYDLARGDGTPIGITNIPHDPPTAETLYEKACEQSYDGTYQPTGKWFTRTTTGYSFLPRAQSQSACEYKSRGYATAYNARMVELAPGEVRKFCSSQKLSADARIGAASIAVFGRSGSEEVLNGVPHRTRALWVIDTKAAVALVTSSQPLIAGQPCDQCEPDIGVAYLHEDKGVMTLRRRWPIVWTGGFKKRSLYANSLSVYDMLTSSPLLATQHCGWNRLAELRPEGPINRGAIYGPQLSFENIGIDQTFDVVMRDPDVLDHYEMVDGRFVGPHGQPPDAC
jgi:hypothetical protein